MRVQYEQRRSGLIAPAEPKPPPAPRGPIEYSSDSDRKAVAQALENLWTAMGLHKGGGGIVPPDTPRDTVKDARKRLFMHVKTELLGDWPDVQFVGGWEYT